MAAGRWGVLRTLVQEHSPSPNRCREQLHDAVQLDAVHTDHGLTCSRCLEATASVVLSRTSSA